MIHWQLPIDIYCERLTPEFWAEPLNALTNVAFFIAAFLLAQQMHKMQIKDKRIYWLIAWIVIIGAGSFAFHTLATQGASLLDVIPIAIFIVSFIAIFFRMVLRWKLQEIIAPVALFFLLGYMSRFVPDDFTFNGTIQYAPAFIFLVCLTGVMHKMHGIRYSRPMWLALALLIASMILRSIDMLWCESNPIGTHFLWHLLNGGVLYMVVLALLHYRIKT